MERIAKYRTTGRLLASLSDRELSRRLDDTPPIGTGIGGTSSLLEVGGTPVFVKRVPLTEREARPDNAMSTANVFNLPPFYQYGVGSTGFGAGRELAAHVMTSEWVVSQRSASFPLMYHWRVLAGSPSAITTREDWADVERSVAYWGGSTAVRARLEAVAKASASLLLCLEYFPHNLRDWLARQEASPGVIPPSAIAMVERSLLSDVASMNADGLFHFDAHFRNILTDGSRLYFADFGLATSPRFELSAAETKFLATNMTHDICYTLTELVNWLVGTLAPGDDRNDLVARWAGHGVPDSILPAAAAVIRRYAPIAVVMNDFYWKLHGESRTTPYPRAAIQDAFTRSGFQPGALC